MLARIAFSYVFVEKHCLDSFELSGPLAQPLQTHLRGSVAGSVKSVVYRCASFLTLHCSRVFVLQCSSVRMCLYICVFVCLCAAYLCPIFAIYERVDASRPHRACVMCCSVSLRLCSVAPVTVPCPGGSERSPAATTSDASLELLSAVGADAPPASARAGWRAARGAGSRSLTILSAPLENWCETVAARRRHTLIYLSRHWTVAGKKCHSAGRYFWTLCGKPVSQEGDLNRADSRRQLWAVST